MIRSTVGAGLLLACVALSTGCAPRRGATASAAPDTIPTLTLSRGACYGRCPIYSLALFDDGRTVFTGIQFTRLTGSDTAHVSRDAVDSLRRALESRRFDALPARITSGTTLCGAYAPDLPTVALSLRTGDAVHRVEYDGGCMDHPRWLDSLATLVDSVAGTSRWTIR